MADAMKLSSLKASVAMSTGKAENDENRTASQMITCNLLVFDATWHHAKEMVQASSSFLQSATRVCLDDFNADMEGGSIYDSELILRKEPCEGCVSTAEAVARWVQVMEENGEETAARLLEVLREMVRMQMQFIRPMKPRVKLGKKGRIVAEEK